MSNEAFKNRPFTLTGTMLSGLHNYLLVNRHISISIIVLVVSILTVACIYHPITFTLPHVMHSRFIVNFFAITTLIHFFFSI